MDEEKKVEVVAVVKPEEVTFPEGTPQFALVSFLENWKQAKYDEMLKYTQATWRETVPSAGEILKRMFAFKPQMIIVRAQRQLSPIVYEADIQVRFYIAREVVKENQVTVRVLKEEGPLAPSEKGTWGVNPPSAYVC